MLRILSVALVALAGIVLFALVSVPTQAQPAIPAGEWAGGKECHFYTYAKDSYCIPVSAAVDLAPTTPPPTLDPTYTVPTATPTPVNTPHPTPTPPYEVLLRERLSLESDPVEIYESEEDTAETFLAYRAALEADFDTFEAYARPIILEQLRELCAERTDGYTSPGELEIPNHLYANPSDPDGRTTHLVRYDGATCRRASPTPISTPIFTPEPTPVRVQIEVLTRGNGATAVAGDTVVVHYTGWLTDGTKFDSSLDRGRPFEFELGAGIVIQGWDEGVVGMRVGGKRRLTIPPELAYGDRSVGDVIPPGATLVFELELLEVR